MFRETIQFRQPLRKVRLTYAGPPAVSTTQVETLVAEAVQQAREAAEDEGKQQLLEARVEYQHLHDQVLGSINERYESLVDEIHSRLPGLLMAGLRRLLPEVALNGDAVEQLVMDTARGLLEKGEAIEVRLCEADLAALREASPDFEARHPRLTFTSDGGLGRGDCLISSRYGQVDARVEVKLNRLEREVTRE